MKRICVIGAGSAGAIASSYIKKVYGEEAEVILLYDHKTPGIGVGESLTPIIYDYLNIVGITREDLIKNTEATIKLGLQFNNWLGDGSYFYHGFAEKGIQYNYNNTGMAYDIANNIEYNNLFYSKHYYDDCRLPLFGPTGESLHINAHLLSTFIINKFKNSLTIIDGEVVGVNKDQKGHISSLILKTGELVYADFFIDASGFSSSVFKHMQSDWVDKTSWLPINRCIPNPVQWDFDKQPPYTISEATKDGWILQVPLSSRWGNGYLYCSDFTTDEEAFNRFESFTKAKYGVSLTNTSKVLSFKSGYWKQQWVGNCIAIGLSSGFAEPLEATNIHHTLVQLKEFIQLYNDDIKQYDIITYNTTMDRYYKNIYLYLRFCYNTRRTDSSFWNYITNNTPEEVDYLRQKISTDPLTITSFNNNVSDMFSVPSFTTVASGLKMINKDSYKKWLKNRNLWHNGQLESEMNSKIKEQNKLYTMPHREFIESILSR